MADFFTMFKADDIDFAKFEKKNDDDWWEPFNINEFKNELFEDYGNSKNN